MKRLIVIILMTITLWPASSCKLFKKNDDDGHNGHTIPKDDIKGLVYYHDLATDVVETIFNYYIEGAQAPSCIQMESLDALTDRWNFTGSCQLPDGHTYAGKIRFNKIPGDGIVCVLYQDTNEYFIIDQMPLHYGSYIRIEQNNNNYDLIYYLYLIRPNDTVNISGEMSLHLIAPGQSADGSDKHWQIDNENFDYIIGEGGSNPPQVEYLSNVTVDPLEKQYNCPLALRGKLRVQHRDGEISYYIDYGNVQCDNTVIVYTDEGERETLTISSP